MNYLSLFSGIDAATVAWQPLGWRAVAFSEIEKFPCAVLAHHYPDVPNWGDIRQYRSWPDAAVELIVGGSPCQSFSVAGLRKGLHDPRGKLVFAYLAVVARYRPTWLVWENVPGVLSIHRGRGFGAFLGALGELGYGFAYRILDAQHWGVPQRRRRVFVVGYAGNWRYPAAVLFERESLSGRSAQSRKTGQTVAARSAIGVGTCGTDDTPAKAGHLIAFGSGVPEPIDTAGTVTAKAGARYDFESETFIAARETGAGYWRDDGLGSIRCTTAPTQPQTIIAFSCKDNGRDAQTDITPTLRSMGHSDSHAKNGGGHMAVTDGYRVRRLMPVETERLQGFPDHYTRIPYRGKPADRCPDGPRYKALGNSMAVPVVRWIGERITKAEKIHKENTA